VSLEISPISVADLLSDPAIGALVLEYEAEARSPELPDAQPQWQQYAAWEDAGVLDVIAARQDGKLIGFVSVLRSSVPHYARSICVVESLFVSAARRRTGAGRALIRSAEGVAAKHSAPLLITAPAGSALEVILPRLGYRHSNTVFVRRPA